ncbi:MAG: hypothetical protein ACI9GB_001658 [Halioglobus sp.]|jgi:hypothetical protein
MTTRKRSSRSLSWNAIDEIRRFVAASKRKPLRAYAKEAMNTYKDEFEFENGVRSFLADQRCVIDSDKYKGNEGNGGKEV